jgi:hypothetical protein
MPSYSHPCRICSCCNTALTSVSCKMGVESLNVYREATFRSLLPWRHTNFILLLSLESGAPSCVYFTFLSGFKYCLLNKWPYNVQQILTFANTRMLHILFCMHNCVLEWVWLAHFSNNNSYHLLSAYSMWGTVLVYFLSNSSQLFWEVTAIIPISRWEHWSRNVKWSVQDPGNSL